LIAIIKLEYNRKNDHKTTVVLVYKTNAHANIAKLAGIAYIPPKKFHPVTITILIIYEF
jgi:hypothetical protein